MALNIETLLQKQKLCFENIKTIVVNYGKDGRDRKSNPEYLKKRLDALNYHWDEFVANNDELLLLPDRDIEYFKECIFEKTQDMYSDLKQKILTAQLSLSVSFSPLLPQKGDEEGPKQEGAGNTNLLNSTLPEDGKKLLRQQLQNFTAFERTVSKINLNDLEDKWELEDSLALLKSRWDAIDKLHWDLDFLFKDVQPRPAYDGEYCKLEKIHDTLKKEINLRIWADRHCEQSTPKVHLPDFNGNYNQWVSFRDMYVETIHSSKWLTKSQKMQHLKSKLKGEPERLVQHLNISADNYDSCWEILVNRYENKRLLFSSYINTILNLPNIQVASAAGLKKMHDTLLECVNGLTNIGLDITTWDPLIVHLLLPKLDSTTYGDYIHDLENPRDLPDLTNFLSFLEVKFLALETLKQNHSNQKHDFIPKKQFTWPQKQIRSNNLHNNNERSMNFKPHEKRTNTYHALRPNCPLCKDNHYLMQCFTFHNLDASARNDFVTKNKFCKNCLADHHGQECISTKTCKLCSKKHHTLLHMDNLAGGSKPSTSNGSAQRAANHVTSDDTEVLLTTVQLMVKNADGNYVTLRALLDQGSQVSLITENAAQRLRLKRQKLRAVISGIGAAQGNSKGLMTIDCKSMHTDFTFNAEVLIMNKLISNLPSTKINSENWEHLRTLKLADPDFFTPGSIDMLLGADIYSIIIQDGVLKQDKNCPVAQHTKLGWILSGNVTKTFNCFITLNEFDNLNKFWEIEEINNENDVTSGDDYCEKHYTETTTRLPTGQYVVKMPMKEGFQADLGKSKPQAVSQFRQLERKMERQEHFAKQYKQFIAEYENLGHMTPATHNIDQPQCFLPHHGVIREESLTTKLRVVFNASMKTDTKCSLNDLMEKGPNLQKDISTLILMWRTYRYALTADIEKMFRAIFLHKDQRSLQKIIWRSSPQDLLQEMELTTVTYGTKAAPFLAMRTLKQLADDEGHAYPMAEKALRHQFYMDDVITGHNTMEGARELQKQLYDLLRKGGFILRKWASNESAVLHDVTNKQKSQSHIFNFKQDSSSTKTLGIGWNTDEDSFCFDWDIQPRDQNKLTKRMLLSDISKLYDPLGWLAPIIISTKLLFQQLWSSDVAWDEQIPQNIAGNWEKIRSELIKIKNISIPRWIHCINRRIELHGFSDASEKAYACVIYTKTVNDRGDYVTTLLTSKTKVAPLKKKVSLPRLELCGALLLVKLMEKTVAALSENNLDVHCWTDSQVVLAWLQGDNKKWEKYVSNRVAIINNIVPATRWSYVNTKENPADCATRGLLPSQLLNFPLWWEGPLWLKTKSKESGDIKQPQPTFSTDEERTFDCCVTRKNNEESNDAIIKQLLERHSSITRATRCLAWVLRYMTKLRHKAQAINNANLSIDELNDATERFIKLTQRENFYEDVNNLCKSGTVSSKSKLLNLTPFLDKKGILRVGGRLRNSNLSVEAKHPAILPHTGRLTELIVERAHSKTLHGGVRLTLAETRQRYWILGGNRAVKGLIRRCIRCHRFKSTKNCQIMGNLPEPRVTASRPFTHCGVDFTGHVDVKLNKGRGVKTCKGYIAIFICLSTKAVHIELVSDLSTQTFLAALKRLCARRGTPKHIYSDNGTNFKGAARILHDEFQEYQTLSSPEFFHAICEQEIEWHFLCPH